MKLSLRQTAPQSCGRGRGGGVVQFVHASFGMPILQQGCMSPRKRPEQGAGAARESRGLRLCCGHFGVQSKSPRGPRGDGRGAGVQPVLLLAFTSCKNGCMNTNKRLGWCGGISGAVRDSCAQEGRGCGVGPSLGQTVPPFGGCVCAAHASFDMPILQQGCMSPRKWPEQGESAGAARDSRAEEG